MSFVNEDNMKKVIGNLNSILIDKISVTDVYTKEETNQMTVKLKKMTKVFANVFHTSDAYYGNGNGYVAFTFKAIDNTKPYKLDMKYWQGRDMEYNYLNGRAELVEKQHWITFEMEYNPFSGTVNFQSVKKCLDNPYEDTESNNYNKNGYMNIYHYTNNSNEDVYAVIVKLGATTGNLMHGSCTAYMYICECENVICEEVNMLYSKFEKTNSDLKYVDKIINT